MCVYLSDAKKKANNMELKKPTQFLLSSHFSYFFGIKEWSIYTSGERRLNNTSQENELSKALS